MHVCSPTLSPAFTFVLPQPLPAAGGQAGCWEQPRALHCLPARQEIASSMTAAHSNAANLVLMDRLLPEFLLGRYSLLCDKDEESKLVLSRCFHVWFRGMGEREEGENNGNVLLKQAVSKGQSRRKVPVPPRVWPGLERGGTKNTHQSFWGKSGSTRVLKGYWFRTFRKQKLLTCWSSCFPE